MQSLLKIPSCTGSTVCSWASLNLDQGAKVLTMGCGVSSAGGGADTESRLGRDHSEDDGDEDSRLDFR